MDELNIYRKQALAIAKDFDYPEVVFRKIHEATSVTQISNIMHDAQSLYL